MITSIQNWTLAQLEAATIYGTAAAVLYVGVVTMILWIEAYGADKNSHGSGVGHLMSAIMRSTVLIIGWLLFVTIVLFLIVGAVNHPTGNTLPAYGIWAFWNVDWINHSVIASLTATPPCTIYLDHGETGLQMAQSLAFFMSVSKYVEIIVLGFILVILMKMVGWNQINNLQSQSVREREYTSFGDLIAFLFVFLAAIISYELILSLINEMIESVLKFSERIHVPLPAPGPTINVMDDVWLMLKQAVTSF